MDRVWQLNSLIFYFFLGNLYPIVGKAKNKSFCDLKYLPWDMSSITIEKEHGCPG